MKTKDIFISDNSIAISLIKKYEYPYMVLPEIKDYIINLGKTLPKEYELLSDNIWIHKTASVSDTASITGPCIIDEGANVRHSAFIRGNAYISTNRYKETLWIHICY